MSRGNSAPPVRRRLRAWLIAAVAGLPITAVLAATQYLYDDLGRLVLEASNDGSAIVYAHDENGNVLSITSQAGLAVATFSPTYGYVGVPITIVGSGFDPDASDNTVTMGGVTATVTSATSTALVAPIPFGASTGPISVTVAGNTAVSTQSLVVVPAPAPPATMTWLMGFEGPDGGAPNDDESSANRTVTVGGNAQIDTGVALIGTSSLLLDGSGDYVRVADNPAFEANGPFVAEVTLRRNDSNRLQVIFAKRNSGSTQHGWSFGISASNQLYAHAWAGSAEVAVSITSVATLTSGVTYKVALERTAAGLWTIYLDGFIVAQDTETVTPTGNNDPLYLGRDAVFSARDFKGWMDEARFSREALYNATPYSPTAGPFPR
jgi:YD repeat-containing protein